MWITLPTVRSKIVSVKKLLEVRTNAVQSYGIRTEGTPVKLLAQNL